MHMIKENMDEQLGYPLLSVQRTRKLLCSRTPPGVFHSIPTLATPKDRAVVLPNNDTLYASGWYDLRQGDLEVTIPPMDHPERYWNLMAAHPLPPHHQQEKYDLPN